MPMFNGDLLAKTIRIHKLGVVCTGIVNSHVLIRLACKAINIPNPKVRLRQRFCDHSQKFCIGEFQVLYYLRFT